MNDPRKIVPIEELRRKAAGRGKDLDTLSEADILALAEEFRKELGELPDVRMDRVALAKARISKGYYTGERIADGLLDSVRGPTPPAPIPLRADPDGGDSSEASAPGPGSPEPGASDAEEPEER